MDNFHIDVTARGKLTLVDVLDIAFRFNCPGKGAESWAIVTIPKDIASPIYKIPEELEGETVLIFRWAKTELFEMKKSIKAQGQFPFKADYQMATDFAWKWLQQAELGPEPDMDGDCERDGWRAFIGSWGHFGPDQYSIIAIKPQWVMLGK
jgi:hypothetical protein